MTVIRLYGLALSAALLSILATPAAAEMVAGTATALDGDSLTAAGQPVRLAGIDAPEFDQTCTREGQAWACGQEAKAQLAALIVGRRVECTGLEHDAYARLLAACTAGYVALNQTLVASGWAVAYRAYSDAYVGEEVRAKAAKLGIWSSEFIPPADYRHGKLPAAAGAAARIRARTPTTPRASQTASGCVVKGNHSRRGEWIYHLPGMPYYAATRPEALFCSEEDAIRAGYRRARVQR